MANKIKVENKELCAVLKYMPNEYVKKIPKKIIKLFQSEKLKNYEPNINKLNPLDRNYLSRKTMVLIAMLNYQYWHPNRKIKDDLYKVYLSNNDKYQKEIKERYSWNNLLKNKKNINQIDNKEPKAEIIEYKESIFKEIINKIKSIFYR